MRPTRTGSITHFWCRRSVLPTSTSTSAASARPNRRLSASSMHFLPDRPLETGSDESHPIEPAGERRIPLFGGERHEGKGVVDDERVFLGLVISLEETADRCRVVQLGEQVARNLRQGLIHA